jgi:multidrug efflux pump
MRHAMGVAVFSGMLGVTFFGLVLTPVFYVAIRALATRRDQSAPPPAVLSPFTPKGGLEEPTHA